MFRPMPRPNFFPAIVAALLGERDARAASAALFFAR